MRRRSLAISRFSSRRTVWTSLLGGLFIAACSPSEKTPVAPVTVFAAASLTDALGEIATVYERTSGQPVRLSFAASGAVARQIQAGAPADVVMLADAVWMDRLQAADRLAPPMRFMALAVRFSAFGALSLPPPHAASTRLSASGRPVVFNR